MSHGKMRYKAGKLCFLLVCLFFCTGCSGETAVFYAGETAWTAEKEETQSPDAEEQEEQRADETAKQEVTEDKDQGSSLVNINTADRASLMTLPGIGETRAAAIIEYRETGTGFEKIEDIMNVKGIKTGVFNKIKSLICVK